MKALLAAALLVLSSASRPAEAALQRTAYEEGVAARLAGETERALKLLAAAVAAEPGDADAHLQYGLALMAAGRDAEAGRALRRTLELASDYRDAKEALARLQARSGGANPVKWQVDVDGSYSDVRGGQPHWKEGRLQVHRRGGRTAVTALVEGATRFGRTDVYGELRVDRTISEGAGLWVSVGGTPNADFRAESQLSIGGFARLSHGPTATVLTLEGRQARFRSGDIQTLIPGLEQYVGGCSYLTARMINIFDETGEHHAGWFARGDYVASQRLRLFAGAADAPDVSEGVVTESFAIFGGASIDLNERQAIRLSVAHEDRESGSDRLQLGLGYGFRF